MTIQPLQWKNDRVFMLDQRILPEKELYLECRTYQDVAHAIKCMVVRGAPAVGVAAGMGIALGVQAIPGKSKKEFLTQFDKICNTIAATRPTAVNLFWAIEKMKNVVYQNLHVSLKSLKRLLKREALKILREDIEKLGKKAVMLARNKDHTNSAAQHLSTIYKELKRQGKIIDLLATKRAVQSEHDKLMKQDEFRSQVVGALKNIKTTVSGKPDANYFERWKKLKAVTGVAVHER